MTHTYDIKALTGIWTGDVNGKPDRLITTGLLGSIRWWFEVLVRGLGGSACDPSNAKCIDDRHCVVCEFFGCTGWARKFRFDVLNADNVIQQTQIKRGTLRFTPLRPIRDEEWVLLDLTLRVIANYGAIGGKTVFKPTDEASRQKELHHKDFGLIELLPSPDGALRISAAELRKYVGDARWSNPSQEGITWASLTNFWSVSGHYLSRQGADKSTFNAVLGRFASKGCCDCGQPHDPPAKCPNPRRNPETGKILAPHRKSEFMRKDATASDRWLAGDQQISKKVFSFRDPPRTYGFINPSNTADKVTLEDIKQRLGAAWQRTIVEEEVATSDECRIQILTGSKILEGLLRAQEAKL